MKIVCDACSAKYSIADEKVRGKVFKIRCKKCSNIIVVRGTTGESDAAQQSFDQKETRVFDYAGYDKGGDAAAEGAVWHVVIDQEQVGPLSAPEVFERYSRGEIDDETYTWREGFADWQPLSQVEAFANIASAAGASAPAPAAAPAPADDVAGMFGGPSIDDSAAPQDDPGDLFAAAGGSSGGSDLFGSGGGGGGVGMAATMPAPSGGSSMADGLFGDEDEPDPAADRQLTGQRNENSVLFSLGNLAALAGDSARSPSAPAPSSSGGGFGGGSSSGMAGADGQEGSGLIDIRAMANAYLGDKSAGAAGPAAAAPMDDLPSFGQSSFDAPSAVLLPTTAPSGGNNKILYALMAVIGILVVAATVLIIVVVKGGGDKKVAAAGSEAGKSDTSNKAGSDSSDKGDKPDKDDKGDKTAATDKSEKDEGDEKDDKSDKSESADKGDKSESADKSSKKPTRVASRRDSKRDRRRDRKRDHGTKPEKTPPKSSGGRCPDEVSCLLADNPPACCSKYKKGSRTRTAAKKPAANTNLPETLSRSDIQSGMGGVRGRVAACSGGKGLVKVRIRVSSSGRVASSSVVSSPTPALGGCVARAVRSARFKKTQKGRSFTYPFMVR